MPTPSYSGLFVGRFQLASTPHPVVEQRPGSAATPLQGAAQTRGGKFLRLSRGATLLVALGLTPLFGGWEDSDEKTDEAPLRSGLTWTSCLAGDRQYPECLEDDEQLGWDQLPPAAHEDPELEPEQQELDEAQ